MQEQIKKAKTIHVYAEKSMNSFGIPFAEFNHPPQTGGRTP